MSEMALLSMPASTQTAKGAPLTDSKPVGQGKTSFAALMGSYSEEPSTVTDGRDSALALFQLQLNQLLQLVEELDEEGLIKGLDELEVETDEDALLGYLIFLLQQFTNETSEDSKSMNGSDHVTARHEKLYTLLQGMPLLPIPEEADQLKQQTNQFQQSVATDQAFKQWNALLAELLTFIKTERHASAMQEGQPQQALMLTLLNQWREDKEWLSFLQSKVEQTRIQLGKSTEADKQFLARGFMPFFLLNQSEQVMGEQANQSEGKASLVKAESLPSFMEKNQIVQQAGIEAKETNLDTSLKMQSLMDARVSEGKQVESQPQTIRFSHLSEDLEDLFTSRLRLLKDGETSQLRLRLTPEHLGHLDIRITSQQGKIVAQLIASSTVAKELLEMQVNQLRHTLVQQGIQVERIEVTQQSSQTTSHFFEQRDGQQFFQQKEQKGGLSKGNYPLEMEEEQQDPSLEPFVSSQINYVV